MWYNNHMFGRELTGRRKTAYMLGWAVTGLAVAAGFAAFYDAHYGDILSGTNPLDHDYHVDENNHGLIRRLMYKNNVLEHGLNVPQEFLATGIVGTLIANHALYKTGRDTQLAKLPLALSLLSLYGSESLFALEHSSISASEFYASIAVGSAGTSIRAMASGSFAKKVK
jgi:hypothetical protein